MMMILYNNWPLMFFTWIITLLSHRNVKVAFRINISFFPIEVLKNTQII